MQTNRGARASFDYFFSWYTRSSSAKPSLVRGVRTKTRRETAKQLAVSYFHRSLLFSAPFFIIYFFPTAPAVNLQTNDCWISHVNTRLEMKFSRQWCDNWVKGFHGSSNQMRKKWCCWKNEKRCTKGVCEGWEEGRYYVRSFEKARGSLGRPQRARRILVGGWGEGGLQQIFLSKSVSSEISVWRPRGFQRRRIESLLVLHPHTHGHTYNWRIFCEVCETFMPHLKLLIPPPPPDEKHRELFFLIENYLERFLLLQ